MRFINILDLTSDEKESENNKQFMDSVSKYDFGIQGNLEKAINIINKNKAYDVERKKVSINMLDEGLSKLGLSCLQGFDNLDKIEQRAAESIIIDNYLEVSVKDIYDGDMITTNAKRIKMIKEKMQEEGKENNPVAKKAFEICVKHFIRDYKTLSQCYDKRVDMEGFDFDKYTEKLQDTFMELGIDNKDIELMDETDIFKQIKEELKIQEFLKEQGYVENPEVNLANRSLNRLKFLNDVLYKSAVKDYKEGNIEEDELGSIPISENFDKAYDTINLVKKSIVKKIHETENPEEIIEKLKEMGYTFNNKGEVDFVDKLKKMIEMAEKQAELEKQQETNDKSNAMDNLKASYEDEGIGQEDLEKERNRFKGTIDQEQNLNEPTKKQGEVNDDH